MNHWLTTALLALAGWSATAQAAPNSTAQTVPDTLAQRVLACTGCHGQADRASRDAYFPRIAGKPAGYLYNQLQNFKDGHRTYPAMTHLTDQLSDAYLREIANHFAGLALPYPAPAPSRASTTDLARGEALVRQGNPQRDLPACAECHGDAMTGRGQNIPGLVGLPKDYLQKQLGAWRTGQRRAATPDCMASIARRMSLEEIDVVASWLAAQRVPANAKAAPDRSTPLPLDCGSVRP